VLAAAAREARQPGEWCSTATLAAEEEDGKEEDQHEDRGRDTNDTTDPALSHAEVHLVGAPHTVGRRDHALLDLEDLVSDSEFATCRCDAALGDVLASLGDRGRCVAKEHWLSHGLLGGLDCFPRWLADLVLGAEVALVGRLAGPSVHMLATELHPGLELAFLQLVGLLLAPMLGLVSLDGKP